MYNYWGGKTLYYSLINKQGAKAALKKEENVIQFTPPVEIDDVSEDCEACKL
jgi:hypothetical protein